MDFIKSFLHFIIFMSPIPEQHVLMHNSASTQSLAKKKTQKKKNPHCVLMSYRG